MGEPTAPEMKKRDAEASRTTARKCIQGFEIAASEDDVFTVEEATRRDFNAYSELSGAYVRASTVDTLLDDEDVSAVMKSLQEARDTDSAKETSTSAVIHIRKDEVKKVRKRPPPLVPSPQYQSLSPS